MVARPHHAQSSTAAAAATSGHIDEAPASARPNADGPPPAAQGAMKSATSATAATTMVARSRDDCTNAGGASVAAGELI